MKQHEQKPTHHGAHGHKLKKGTVRIPETQTVLSGIDTALKSKVRSKKQICHCREPGCPIGPFIEYEV